MSSETENHILADVKRVDDASLTDTVRNATADPNATLLGARKSTQLKTLSIGNGTLGFFKVESEVSTSDGIIQWSTVIKAIEPSGTDNLGRNNDPDREIEAYRSSFFRNSLKSTGASGNRGMKAAPCYRVEDRPDGTVWLWLADLSKSWLDEWSEDDYIFAAAEIGKFNGSSAEHALQGEHWLERSSSADYRRAILNSPSFVYPLDRILTEGLVQRAVNRIGLDRVARLRDDLLTLVDATESFPRTVAHNDCHPRNLFNVRSDINGSELVAIDWASVGWSPAGFDGGHLAGSGFTWGHDEANMLQRIEQDVFDAYFEALVGTGWQGPRWQTRLAYLSIVSTYMLQGVMSVGQAAIEPEGPFAAFLKSRFRVNDLTTFGDEWGERLSWMFPLIEEALEIAATSR